MECQQGFERAHLVLHRCVSRSFYWPFEGDAFDGAHWAYNVEGFEFGCGGELG